MSPLPPPGDLGRTRRGGSGMRLRVHILLFLLVFGLAPLLLAVAINLPLVLERTSLFYQQAYLLNLRADFRDLEQHLASRHEMIRLLAKLPEPGLILGDQGDSNQVDLARARYTGWINQILADQRDIIEAMFVGSDAQERFWLVRDPRSQTWHPTPKPPQLPHREMVEAGLALQPGAVMVSRIRVDPQAGARDPRQLITMTLVSPIGGSESGKPKGAVLLWIDVGGLAEFYPDTVWVNQDGSYLRPGETKAAKASAFADFPGLAEVFRRGVLAVWKDHQGRQFLWVPMFLTEDGLPIWVGRAVDPSPIEEFRNELIFRVLTIIVALVLSVVALAQWIAGRAERFGKELTGGIGQILREGLPRRFSWGGPKEIRELGNQLTALSETHAEHLHTAREHTRELERSNRYKSEFLANVSHELRTPLNSILLLSKMLAAETSGLSTSQRRQAQVIHEAGADLRAMIDNILDISRIEAGHVAVHLEWVDLEPVLQELIELVHPQLADKPVALGLEIHRNAPRRIRTDRDKLRQILKNFLSNAIKFTEEGRVSLTLAPAAEGALPVSLAVSDTGIGIPEDKQAIIFEAFQQADGSTRRRYGGTGLGLSISRQLATVLGGVIQVKSSPGEGARFELRLPMDAGSDLGESPPVPQSIAGPAPEPPALAGGPTGTRETPHPHPPIPPADPISELPGHARWVLIVDRDVRNLVHLADLLDAREIAVQTAADLDEAIETLQEDPRGCVLALLGARSSEGETCDMIATLLKQNQGDGATRAVSLAVVGDDVAMAQVEACREAGAVAFLSKPVSSESLDRLLGEIDAFQAERRSPSREDRHPQPT